MLQSLNEAEFHGGAGSDRDVCCTKAELRNPGLLKKRGSTKSHPVLIRYLGFVQQAALWSLQSSPDVGSESDSESDSDIIPFLHGKD